MDREIDLARQQRAIQLLGPERLAADIGQGAILHLVAGGADRDDLDRVGRKAVRRAKRIGDHIGLPESQRRTARAETEGACHGRRLTLTAPNAKRAAVAYRAGIA